MNEESKDVLCNLTNQLAKDVYQDGGKAIVKPAGELGGLLVRSLKALLAPLEMWTLKKEYNIAETRKLLEQKLDQVNIDLIEPPEPYIGIPAMQYLSYCMDKEELRDMYANLLANSMINTVKDGVHPSYVEIIKQLSPDEAKILRYMSTNMVLPTISYRYQNDKGDGMDVIRDFSDVGEKTDCENKYHTSQYFDNFLRLGLITKNDPLETLVDKTLYDPLKNHPFMEQFKGKREYIDRGFSIEKITEGFIELSSFGRAFCKVCVLPPDV